MKRCLCFLYALFALLLVGKPVLGESKIHNFLNFSTSNGLPSNHIRGLAMDELGMIWISTLKGLCYFDGHKIHTVKIPDIYVNDIGKISFDNKGRLWLATDNQGLLCYDKRIFYSNAVKQYSVKNDTKDVLKSEIYEVFASKSGLIYFGGKETDLQVLNPETGQVKQIRFPLKHSTTLLSIYSISEDKQENIWIGSRYSGIYRYNPKDGTILSIDLNQGGENAASGFVFKDKEVYSMYYDYDLIKYNTVDGKMVTNLLKEKKNKEYYDNTYNCLLYDEKQDEIIAGHTSKGISIYNIGTGQKEIIDWSQICPNCELPIRSNVMLKIKNGYWLGTTNGLFLYDEAINYKNQLILTDNDPIIQLFSLSEEKWYLTKSGFGRISDDYKTKLTYYSLQNIKISQLNVIGNRIYFSSYYNGMLYFDVDSDVKKVLPLEIKGDSKGFRHADCNSVVTDLVDNKLILWIGSWNNGLYKYDVHSKLIERFDQQNGLPTNKIINLAKDYWGDIWLGTDGAGLIKINNKSLVSFELIDQNLNDRSIPSNKVIAFSNWQNSNGTWFTTSRSGINLITQSNGKQVLKYYQDKNKIPFNNVNDIKIDKNENLWLRSSDGFMFFNSKRKSFVQLLPGRGIIPGNHIKTFDLNFFDNNLILCTSRGLLLLDDSRFDFEVLINEEPIISKLSIGNKETNYRLYDNSVLHLLPNENDFSFHFSHRNAYLGNYQFAYKLEGVDRDWILGDEDFQAVYTNIKGGDYVFAVKIGDKDGNWSEAIKKINISLDLHWYETLWFKVLLILGIGGAFFIFFWNRLQQQKRLNNLQKAYNVKLKSELILNEIKIKEQAEKIEIEKQEKLETDFRNKLVESELKAIRSQMNPHFIYNVLNSIESYVIEHDAKSASRLIHKFAALSRIVLENSQFELVSITSEINLIKLYVTLEQDRFEHSFSFDINFKNNLDLNYIKIPPMLLQPIVENAIHHGVRNLLNKQGKIEMNIFQNEKSIFIEILDNGLGFGNSELMKTSKFKTSSFGLKGVQDRLNLINEKYQNEVSTLEITSLKLDDIDYTKVQIQLPLFDVDEI